MTICIYKITNTINNKIYVGQTVNYKKRMNEHFSKSNCTGRKFKNAIKKYGEENFTCEILEYIDPDLERDLIKTLLSMREQYWLDLLQPFDDNGYNLQRFSEKTNLGVRWSDEIKEKISKGLKKHFETNSPHNKGKKLSPEEAERLRSYRVGSVTSEETKKKISEAHKKLGSGKRIQEWVKKNGHPRLTPIVQLDKESGEFIQEFESITQAHQITGIGRTNINNCLTGYSKSAGGFKWKYLKDFSK